MLFFTLATLLPVVLLCAAALLGGGWALAAILAITVLTWALDHLVARAAAISGRDSEFPAGTALVVALGLAVPLLLGLAVWSAGGGAGHGWAARVGIVLGFGLFLGQVAHPVAHELIHRPARWMQALGRAVYGLLLMGQHASSHLRVHHLHVGTPLDPASAPAGMGFWRYAPRAWAGSLTAGLRAETALRARAATPPPVWTHPYIGHALWALAAVAGAFALAGWGGIAALLAVALYAQTQILLSDYIQHYGLRRAEIASGRFEPVGPAHSWNAPQFWSSAMMLNAPRHSHHHSRPAVPFPALELTPQMPVLPRAVPVMAVAALIPPLWRRIMKRPLARITHHS